MISGGLIAAIFGGLLVAIVLFKKEGGAIKEAITHRSGWMFGPTDNKGVNYTKGLPARPTIQGAGWAFDFPLAGKGEVDAVVNYSPDPLLGVAQVVARFTVTGGGFTPSEYPDRVALVGLCLQRKGDDWSGKGAMQGYRFYSPRLTLEAGEHTLSVPLAPASWTDVAGQHNADAFGACLANLDNLAVCFGHSSGAMHGVFATQLSRFTLLSLDIR